MKRMIPLILLLVLGWTNPEALAFETQGVMVGVKGGYFDPRSDKASRIYNHGGYVLSGCLDRDYGKFFELGFGLHFFNLTGHAETVDGRATDAETILQAYGGDMSVRFKFDYYKNQIIIPYLDSGLDLFFLDEDIDDRRKTERVWLKGYHVSLGVRVNLNPLDPVRAMEFRKEYGVQRTFLSLEARYVNLDNFGAWNSDLGALIYSLGLLFEY
ncbi:MAG: hypothetical protein HQK58_06045 [Deltaproteobacteria bacterium]|nr:hypothetical protein [Deltaproteobacteria bacterium]